MRGSGRSPIDVGKTIEHIRYLSEEIGSRFPGSKAERSAADYVARQLTDTDRPVEVQFFDLPNGGRSRNISIFIPGSLPKEFVIGAHIDSAADSPGANDNASGVAILLELANLFSKEGPPVDLRFVFFGSEELIQKGQVHHHYGSRSFVASMADEEVANISGMISVDMAGWGPRMKVHSPGLQPTVVRDGLLTVGARLGLDMSCLTGPAASDHESFESAGVPSSWIGFHRDPENHTPRDTIDRIDSENLSKVAKVVFAFLTNGSVK